MSARVKMMPLRQLALGATTPHPRPLAKLLLLPKACSQIWIISSPLLILLLLLLLLLRLLRLLLL